MKIKFNIAGIPLWFWVIITPFLIPIIVFEFFSWLGVICDVLLDRYKQSLLKIIGLVRK